jgi:hypothetical protein
LIPPSLSSDQPDAAVNSPPAILAIRSDQEELVEPGPVVITRGATTQLNAELLDTDVDDTLYVRFYVNYTVAIPTPSRASCTAPASGSPQRGVSCDITALCTLNDVGTPGLRLEIEVFDRALADSGTPAYKAMDADSGGLSTGRVYELTCNEGT